MVPEKLVGLTNNALCLAPYKATSIVRVELIKRLECILIIVDPNQLARSI